MSGVRDKRCWVLGCIRGEVSMASGIGLCQVQGLNGFTLAGVSICRFVSIFGAPHSYLPLSGFVGLGWTETRFKIYKIPIDCSVAMD